MAQVSNTEEAHHAVKEATLATAGEEVEVVVQAPWEEKWGEERAKGQEEDGSMTVPVMVDVEEDREGNSRFVCSVDVEGKASAEQQPWIGEEGTAEERVEDGKETSTPSANLPPQSSPRPVHSETFLHLHNAQPLSQGSLRKRTWWTKAPRRSADSPPVHRPHALLLWWRSFRFFPSDLVQHQKRLKTFREIFIAFAGAQAGFSFLNFVFGSVAGGAVTLLCLLCCLFAHIDRRAATYLLSVCLNGCVGALVVAGLCTRVGGIELYFLKETDKLLLTTADGGGGEVGHEGAVPNGLREIAMAHAPVCFVMAAVGGYLAVLLSAWSGGRVRREEEKMGRMGGSTADRHEIAAAVGGGAIAGRSNEWLGGHEKWKGDNGMQQQHVEKPQGGVVAPPQHALLTGHRLPLLIPSPPHLISGSPTVLLRPVGEVEPVEVRKKKVGKGSRKKKGKGRILEERRRQNRGYQVPEKGVRDEGREFVERIEEVVEEELEEGGKAKRIRLSEEVEAGSEEPIISDGGDKVEEEDKDVHQDGKKEEVQSSAAENVLEAPITLGEVTTEETNEAPCTGEHSEGPLVVAEDETVGNGSKEDLDLETPPLVTARENFPDSSQPRDSSPPDSSPLVSAVVSKLSLGAARGARLVSDAKRSELLEAAWGRTHGNSVGAALIPTSPSSAPAVALKRGRRWKAPEAGGKWMKEGGEDEFDDVSPTSACRLAVSEDERGCTTSMLRLQETVQQTEQRQIEKQEDGSVRGSGDLFIHRTKIQLSSPIEEGEVDATPGSLVKGCLSTTTGESCRNGTAAEDFERLVTG
eukprot:GHVS01079342.1.p1 GENE.GHVS01079342.1~~GHVS01079342.1.p1  ORF type:complete len:807 (+),score=203.54 GHVS01079342.1:164-2584(+)